MARYSASITPWRRTLIFYLLKIEQEMENLFRQFIVSLLMAIVAISAYPEFDPGNTLSNCISPLTEASCTGFVSRAGFRTIDGTCNNLRFPTAGAANTPLSRLLKAQYADNFDTPRGFPGTSPVIPTANQVSEELFKVEKHNKGTGDLAVMFMTMGQFLDHDIGVSPDDECDIEDCSSPDAFKYPCFPIPFKNGGSECTSFGRSVPVCPKIVTKLLRRPRNQLNILTAFVDGSQIYGSTFMHHERVRSLDGTGQLRLTWNGLLPIDEERLPCRILGGCSLVGDDRGDENIALHSMHTLWAREHNRIARDLRLINPHWNEEDLYQNARKIVGAMLQHIIYEEWLPNIVRLPTYKGYNKWLIPSITNGFSTAAFRFGHSLIPNKFSLLNGNFDDVQSPIKLQAAFRNRQFIVDTGIEPILLGLAGNKSNNVDNGFAFGIVRKLFIRPGKSGRMDLTARNIQRGRDHGIPTYGKWRRACRLPTVNNFYDLEAFMLKGTVDVFRKIYSSPKDIDLFAAGISEKHVPGLQVGPTFECIFRHQYSLLRDADRFFYLAKGVFTETQVNALAEVTMARVLCNNLYGIVSVQPKAFKVDTAAKNRRIACENIPKLDLCAWKQ